MPRDCDLAWAAGFFDGEGYTGVHNSQGKYRYVRVGVSQKDLRPLERFHEIVGEGAIGKKRPSSGVSSWRVSSTGALHVLEQLWPYLSEPKREQAIRTLEEVGRGMPTWITAT